MSAQIDCPICMDCIETSKNCVTTECGHCFHTSCLMTSVAHNGFGCPYCRTKMAEEPEEEETVWSDDDEEEEEEEEEDMFDENALRGFRFFWNNQNGEEHDEDDDADEQQLEEWAERASEEEEEQSDIPSASFIAQKLQQQGVSYEQLVTMILLDHDEYSENEEPQRIGGEIYGKVRIIVNNYNPEQAVQAVPQPVVTPVPQSIVAPVPQSIVAPVVAEPKNYSRRIMMHV